MDNNVNKNRPDGTRPQPPEEHFSDDYDYPDGYEPQKTGKAAMIVAITAAVVIALAVAVFFVYIFFFSDAGKEQQPAPTHPVVSTAPAEPTATAQAFTENGVAQMLSMPDLSGMKEADAYKALNAAGIKYKVTREYSDDVASGYVITQSPWAKTEISRNDEALVYISKGGENQITPTPRSQTTTAATSATKPKSSSAADDEYLLPDSDSRMLAKSDLTAFDREELNLALNEIFARHGRIFSDPDIKAYFNSKSWYNGTVSAADFDVSVLNSYETYNVNLISAYQEELGYR